MIELVELSEGVWASQSEDHISAILLGERSAALIDPTDLPELLNAFDRFAGEMKRPVEILIYTDSAQGQGVNRGIAHWPNAAQAIAPVGGERMPLSDGLPAWELLSLQSNSGASLAVYNAAERVLFCGAMLVGASIPKLSGGSQPYLDNLETLEKLDVKLAIPSRGTPASGKRAIKERIEADRNYIYSLLRHMITSKAANVTLDRLVQVAAQIYEDSPHVEAHLANMRYIWQEMGW